MGDFSRTDLHSATILDFSPVMWSLAHVNPRASNWMGAIELIDNIPCDLIVTASADRNPSDRIDQQIVLNNGAACKVVEIDTHASRNNHYGSSEHLVDSHPEKNQAPPDCVDYCAAG